MSQPIILEATRKPVEAAPRIKTQGRLKVVSKTLGTRYQYQFDTQNASSSGLLLASIEGGHIPFLENTIVELTIDPECHWGQQPVLALGKVIRRETVVDESQPRDPHRVTRIGVQIVQIDSDQLVAWESCRERLAAA